MFYKNIEVRGGHPLVMSKGVGLLLIRSRIIGNEVLSKPKQCAKYIS